MRHAWFAMLLASAGCNSILGIDDLTVARDGGIDPPDGVLIDAPPNYDCYGTVVNACFPPPAPTNALELAGTLLTHQDARCKPIMQANGVEVCAIYAKAITIGTDFVVSGTRPLMLVATDSITVANPINAASQVGMKDGPGANPTGCLVPNPGSDSANDGGGGGAGGTFGGTGAAGGKGGQAGGGAGAAPVGVSAFTGLRGGCPGSNGGKGNNAGNNDPGAGGSGGGALYLYAANTITITSRINASGGGGIGASNNHSGGGGGGAGGMVVLEAPTITLEGASAEVFANGGGGGEGTVGSTNKGHNGNECTTYDSAATGGTGTMDGGDGGDGAIQGGGATTGSNGGGTNGNEGGGGGGGGGVGVIQVKGTLAGGSSTQFSPTPTTLP